MRSRYTAFALEDRDYLLKSWHSSTRPQQLELDAVNWLGLKIEAYMPLTSTLARVKFVAKGKDASGQLFKLKENSRFVKEHGHWYYVDGKIS